jgi:D-glycero-alpha-D-manno-heptose-7-phosphate kinase
MILARVPLRISFLGGGSDLKEVYRKIPGRVLSTTIDKYVYIAINKPELLNTVSVRYAETETVRHPSELKHPLFRTALLDLGIERNIEIGSFASVPAKTGLGSSSSFSVGLAKGLSAYLGKKITKEEAARLGCRFEVELLKEPIGKQDHYAASYGGLNVIEFLPDETVSVRPVLIDFSKRRELNRHLLLFFTGIMREAKSVLSDQRERVSDNIDRYKKMTEDVFRLEELLFKGDMRDIGELLHQGWLNKRKLSTNISNTVIDTLYEAGLNAGAWGGKILGAGGGGCLLFVVPPEKQGALRHTLKNVATAANLSGFQEIPFQFTEGGAEVLFNHLHRIK